MKKFLVILLLLVCINSAQADKWVVLKKFKDVVPVSISYGSKAYTITLESGRWFVCADSYADASVEKMILGSTGTYYWKVSADGKFIREDDTVKWVENKELTKKGKQLKKIEDTSENKKVFSSRKIKETPSTWVEVFRKLPPKDTVVLVKYTNGVITTAYVNFKNEWKLTTDKGRISGGVTLKSVSEWKTIN